MTRRNWADIREKYITSIISLRALARECSVPFGSLHKVASRENWVQARRLCGDTAVTKAVTLAADAAAKLSLPERSAKLRGALVTELERDAKVVAATAPANLEVSQQRQDVVSAITRNAETVLQWNDRTPTPAVRISVLASATVRTDAVLIQDTEQPMKGSIL